MNNGDIGAFYIIKNADETDQIVFCRSADEGKSWSEGMNVATVSYAGKTATVNIHDPFQYKIAFTPAKNLESINGTLGAEYISAEYTEGIHGMPATRFNISAGAAAGASAFSAFLAGFAAFSGALVGI